LNISVFRKSFPEFSDTVKYPTEMITFWATIAEAQVPCRVWRNLWTQGVSLYVAHEITLAMQNAKLSANGGVPGTSGGVANTKTVGSASVGYDAATTTEKDAGWWNLTNYGKQFIHLARIFGAGAIQLIGNRPIIGPYNGIFE
jgi:Protein of unknown function (DUF4054)